MNAVGQAAGVPTNADGPGDATALLSGEEAAAPADSTTAGDGGPSTSDTPSAHGAGTPAAGSVGRAGPAAATASPNSPSAPGAGKANDRATAQPGGGVPGAGPGSPQPTPGGGATDVGVTDKTIKLGTFHVLSGPLAPLTGRDSFPTFQAALQEINANGGIHGRKLEFVVGDTKIDPPTGLAAVKKMVEQDKVFAISGMFDPYTCNVIGSYVDQVKLPVVGCDGSLPDTWGHPWLWTLGAGQRSWSHVAAKFMLEKGWKSVSLLTHTDVSYDPGIAEFDLAMKAGGGKVRRVIRVPFDHADYTPQLVQIRSDNPDGVYQWLHPDQAIKLLLAEQRAGYKPNQLFSPESAPRAVPQSVGKFAEPFYIFGAGKAWDNNSSDAGWRRALSIVRQRAGKNVDFHNWPGFTFTGMMVFAEGAKRVGPNLTRTALKQVLDTTTFQVDSFFDLRWEPTHKCPSSYRLGFLQFVDNDYKELPPIDDPYASSPERSCY
ncbi:MAG: ABC transporter substrate-binding protein [Actinomycetota bacterium]